MTSHTLHSLIHFNYPKAITEVKKRTLRNGEEGCLEVPRVEVGVWQAQANLAGRARQSCQKTLEQQKVRAPTSHIYFPFVPRHTTFSHLFRQMRNTSRAAAGRTQQPAIQNDKWGQSIRSKNTHILEQLWKTLRSPYSGTIYYVILHRLLCGYSVVRCPMKLDWRWYNWSGAFNFQILPGGFPWQKCQYTHQDQV